MRKHSHYFFPIPKGLTEADIYRLIDIVGITCPAAQHVFKKAAFAGRRGHKDLRKDWEDIRDTAIRKLEMLDEDEQATPASSTQVSTPNETPDTGIGMMNFLYKKVVLNGHEIDTDFDSEKERIPAISSNGNDGVHYAPTLPAGYSWADAPPDANVLVMSTTTGAYHWADAFSDGSRIYGARFERMGLSGNSGWKLIAHRPGSDPGWVYPARQRPNLPWHTLVEATYRDGSRLRQVVDDVDWADVTTYRVVEALEQ